MIRSDRSSIEAPERNSRLRLYFGLLDGVAVSVSGGGLVLVMCGRG
jgi:hypothetical protein